jgi:predicted secreted protein
MALATTVKFSEMKLLLKATSGGSYVAPCAMSSRAITFTNDTTEVPVIDCDDEDAIAPMVREKTTRSVTISGEGLVEKVALKRWRQAEESKDPVDMKIVLAGDLAASGGTWQGTFFVTSFSVTAERSDRARIGIEMLSTGAVTWSDAS